MKSKSMKRMVATVMAATLTVNAVPMVKAVSNEEGQKKENQENPILIPQPQSAEFKENEIVVRDSVNVESSKADPVAAEALATFLDSKGIEINETYQESAVSIVLGEADDEVATIAEVEHQLGIDSASTLKNEGYVLAVDPSEAGTIVIEGKDGDGTFYGVQTLEQITTASTEEITIKEATIIDEPTMSTRGIIEGFYGNPWTHQDRIDQIEFYGSMKLNTYIYAPKDDPYHREQWRLPYPESEMTRMNELIKTSKENKVDFVFALSPGVDVKFDGEAGEADLQALISKCQSLYDMGVRSYAIFFDDISNKEGTKQAAFLNRFNNEFIKAKGDITPLITVPTEYDSIAMSNGTEIATYTKDFSATLDKDIMVLWTGSAVVPEGIDAKNAQYVKSIYGDRMGIWWNYPVTDYIKNKLALGPVYNLDKDLKDEVDIFTMNPMEHAELSEITLATGADYSWNTPAYDYNGSFANAVDTLYGELAPYMMTFANHSTRLEAGWASTGRSDAPEVRALMNTMIKKVVKGEDATAEIDALNQEFDNMILAADTLKSAFSAEQLKHCEANLAKLKALGENNKIALSFFLAKVNNDESATGFETTLRKNLSSLQSGALVSEKTALAFITDVLNYDPNPKAGFTVSSTFVAPGEEIQFTNTSSVSTIDLKWSFKGADKESSTDENPVVTYSKEGIYPVKLTAKNSLGEDVVLKNSFITISNEALNENVNLSINKTATASSSTGTKEAPAKAIDGISSTKWCATGRRPHTLTIDLGHETTISSIAISNAEIGGEGSALNTKDYRVQISNDGTNFTEILQVKGNTKGLTNDALPVSIARYVRLIVDAPTQGGDTAARIYEVEVFGLDRAIKLPETYKEDTTLSKAILKTSIDKAESIIASDDFGKLALNVSAMITTRLADAKSVYENINADNEQCLEAWLNLANALQFADFKADKTDLKKLIGDCEDIDVNDYKDGVEAFVNALQTANDVYEDVNALQERINQTYEILTNALNGLVKNDEADKTALANIVHKISEVVGNGENYRHNDAWSTFEAALDSANKVLTNENAKQIEINNAFIALTNAYEDIRLLPNEELLSKFKAYIQFVDELDLTNYSEENAMRIMSVRNEVVALISDLNNFDDVRSVALQNEIISIMNIIESVENPNDVDIPSEVETPDTAVNNETVQAKTPVSGIANTGDSTSLLLLLGAAITSGTCAYVANKKRKNTKK